jgi:hyperosmotically inducible protein
LFLEEYTMKIRTAPAASLCLGLAMSLGMSITASAADPEPSRTAGQTSDDAALLSKIKMALTKADDVKARQVNVEVFQGQVQLLGFVETAEQKAAAGRIASDIAGARNVKNSLEVQQAERSAGQVMDDGVITTKVKAALIGDSRTKAHQIDVETREGIVQLGGFVDSAAARSAATEVAKSVSGVKNVQNRLEVKN